MKHIKKSFWLKVGLLFGIYEEINNDIVIKETGEVIHEAEQNVQSEDPRDYPARCEFKLKDIWRHSRFGGRNW